MNALLIEKKVFFFIFVNYSISILIPHTVFKIIFDFIYIESQHLNNIFTFLVILKIE